MAQIDQEMICTAKRLVATDARHFRKMLFDAGLRGKSARALLNYGMGGEIFPRPGQSAHKNAQYNGDNRRVGSTGTVHNEGAYQMG